jgi:hypothetical protein
MTSSGRKRRSSRPARGQMTSLRHLRHLSGAPVAQVTHPSCATTTPYGGVGVKRRRKTARNLGGAKGGAVWGRGGVYCGRAAPRVMPGDRGPLTHDLAVSQSRLGFVFACHVDGSSANGWLQPRRSAPRRSTSRSATLAKGASRLRAGDKPRYPDLSGGPRSTEPARHGHSGAEEPSKELRRPSRPEKFGPKPR